MEINPRLWGSYALTRAAGSRFADSWRKAAAGLPPQPRGEAPAAMPDAGRAVPSGPRPMVPGAGDGTAAAAGKAPEAPYRTGVKMSYRVNDLAACLSYFRHGRMAKGFGALADILNPFVRDGVFEWRDPKPFFVYLFRKA
jgi:hypothetical protein